MTKAFDLIHAGLLDALAYAEGEADLSKFKVHVPEKVDVKLLRTRMKLTQEEFAQRYHFTSARVKDWEQGRFEPDGATRAYLTVIAREPSAVERALKPPKGAHRSTAESTREIISRAATAKKATATADEKTLAKKRA